MEKNKDILTMLKEAGILFVITIFAGILLGFIYELTKDPIKVQEEKAKQDACKAVFASASEFEETTDFDKLIGTLSFDEGVSIGKVYRAKKDSGETLGYVIESASSKGYGGDIDLYIGIDVSGKIGGISILEISETAGLGMRAEEVLSPQFKEKKAESFVFTKSGAVESNEIDAISGATVTTKAYTEAVNGAVTVFERINEGGGSDE
ncbi:MAG: RnfABCDGE type electron transport complex subunit G [Acetatifactor sp.]|nr:RnfABCDGE type electron transport complex subunit G [Acetatifactor sp.]